jgi:hypothetical protein
MIQFLLPAMFAAGSVGANSMASSQRNEAQARAMAAERERQAGLTSQVFALNDTSRQRYDNADESIAGEQSMLADTFKGITREAPARPTAMVPGSSNVQVRNASRAASAGDRALSDDNAERRAALGGFGSFLGDAGIGRGRDAGQMQTLSGFSRGSQSVLPMELQAALEKGQGWNMLGDLLSLASGVTTQGALRGAPGSTPTPFRLPTLNVGGSNSLFGGNSWGA